MLSTSRTGGSLLSGGRGMPSILQIDPERAETRHNVQLLLRRLGREGVAVRTPAYQSAAVLVQAPLRFGTKPLSRKVVQ